MALFDALLTFVTALLVLAVVRADKEGSLNHTRIVGGSKATDPYPYQISLQVKRRNPPGFITSLLTGDTGEWSHTCGGSIMDNEYVLTAAHCVDGGKPEMFSVLAGTFNRNSGGSRHLVESIKVHPDYQELVTCDIALLKVKPPFEFNDMVKPIELEKEHIGAGVPVTLSGWGFSRPIRFGPLPVYLRTMDYTTISNKDCQDRGFNVSKTEICTYKGLFRGACAGDSGGPLVNKDRTKQIGVVSYGSLICASGSPDAFTRVSEFIDWCKESMNS